jgi:hypothetical protein
MNMVRHDHPRAQSVSLAVKSEQRRFDHTCNLRIAQDAATVAGIYPGLDQLATFNIAQRGRRRAELRFEPQKNFGRQTIGEMKRDVLNNVRRIEVREIPTRVPSNRARLEPGAPRIGIFLAVIHRQS